MYTLVCHCSVTFVEDGETIVKTCTDSWVVAKKSDQREVYVIINQRNANLIEINGALFLHILLMMVKTVSKEKLYFFSVSKFTTVNLVYTSENSWYF